MKKWTSSLIVASLWVLTSCSSEPVSIEQGMEETVPFEIDEIIQKEELTDGAIVLYTTKQTYQDKEFTALATAYLEGNEENGWNNEGDNQWAYEPDAPLQVFYNDVYDYAVNGDVLSRFELTYGQILDANIVKLEGSEGNESYHPVRIIEKKKERFFLELKEYKIIRGVDQHGQIIAEYKQRP